MSSGPTTQQSPSNNSPPLEIHKNESLYYPTGDIVLLSSPKENVVTAFRVDTIFLVRYSPVFEGMLSLPPPADVEKYDGVPFVQLHDDAQDLFDFLRALYEPVVPIGSGKRLARDTVRLVTGMLKLATKYEVKSLRMRIIDVLALDWPKDLESWDENEAAIDRLLEKVKPAVKRSLRLVGLEPELDGNLDDHLAEPCKVIRLAQDYDIPELLPAAFYHLSRIPPFASADLDLPKSSEEYGEYSKYIAAGGRSAKFSLLSQADFCRLRLGCYRISKLLFTMRSSPERFTSGNYCDSRGKCKEVIVDLLQGIILGRATGQIDDVLRRLGRGQNIDLPNKLCHVCSRSVVPNFQSARKYFWEQLPNMFGLVGGEEN